MSVSRKEQTSFSNTLSSSLSLASLDLLTHPHKLNSGIEASQKNEEKKGDVFDLVWPNIATDREKFKSVMNLLSVAGYFKEERFQNYILPIVRDLLDSTELFQFLADPEVILTKAHRDNGCNSAQHIIRVLSELPTNFLDVKHKLILRILACHHDLGKAISSGLKTNEIMQIFNNSAYDNVKDSQGEIKHSFPDHQLSSALIFLNLYERETDQLVKNGISEADINLIAYLIANHHSFARFTLEKDHPFFLNWQEFLPGNKTKKELILAYLFIFNYADIEATPAHKIWLSSNIDWMKIMLPELKTLAKNLHQQIEDVIRRPILDNI